MNEREAIRQRLEAATPGPWASELHGIMDANRSRTIVITGESEQDDADADFIAHAPEDIAFLLDALDEAERERDADRRRTVAALDVAQEHIDRAEARLEGMDTLLREQAQEHADEVAAIEARLEEATALLRNLHVIYFHMLPSDAEDTLPNEWRLLHRVRAFLEGDPNV